MRPLEKEIAIEIIQSVGGSGIPPKYGEHYFSVGIEEYTKAIQDEYLNSVLKNSSAVKMIVGAYGGGKTHFLYEVRDVSWNNNFLVSYVSLSSEATPFHKLERVYAAIADNITRPLTIEEIKSGEEIGIGSLIKYWYGVRQEDLQKQGLSDEEIRKQILGMLDNFGPYSNINFTRAIKGAIKALVEENSNDFDNIVQWLTGQGYDRKIHSKYGILQKIDKSTANQMIRSLLKWIRSPEMGYNGLVILFDEAENVPTMSSKQADTLAQNLREFIDQSKQEVQGMLILYAVPNEDFLNRRGHTYEALKQRFGTYFSLQAPTGVKIDLEKILSEEPEKFLIQVGKKLAAVYGVAYDLTMNEEIINDSIETIAKYAYEQRYGDIGYKRLFAQLAITYFHFYRNGNKDKVNESILEELRKEVN